MTKSSFLPLLLLTPSLILVACKSSSPKGLPKNLPKVNVSSSAAPPRHSMNRGEYPFDARGNYVAAWAAEGSRGGGSIPAPQPHYEEPQPADTPPASNTTKRDKTSRSTRMIVSTAPTSPPPPQPSPPTRAAATTSSHQSPTPAARTTSTQSAPRSTVASAPKPAPKPTPKPKPKPKPTSSTVYHTVKSGDTLYGLALRYKSTVAKIKAASGINSDLLKIGQKLKIPR